MASFKLQRSGKFDAILEGKYHCGNLKGPNTFGYDVEIEVEGLDDRGFIVDNFDIRDYFVQVYDKKPTTRSCEQMAEAAVSHFVRVVGENRIISVTATILPFEDVRISKSYQTQQVQTRRKAA